MKAERAAAEPSRRRMRQTELVPLTQLVGERVAVAHPRRGGHVELGHMFRPATMRILLRNHTNPTNRRITNVAHSKRTNFGTQWQRFDGAV